VKRMFWLLAVFVVLLAVAACNHENDEGTTSRPTFGDPPQTSKEDVEVETEVEEDGGQKESVSPDAPKEIHSTEITEFHITFSGLALPEEDTYLSGRVYDLRASLTGGTVKGRYSFYDRMGDSKEKTFDVEVSFMKDLQQIVSSYDFAAFNGVFVSVSGLPDMYGCDLHVNYESGEYIYASDNQGIFIALPALEALESLFRSQWEVEMPISLDFTVLERYETKESSTGWKSVRYPQILLGYQNWSGTYVATEGYEALNGVLDNYNAQVEARQQAELSRTESLGGSYHSDITLQVTRNDDVVAAFAEKAFLLKDGQEQDSDWTTYNIDAKTGKMLGYTDVFPHIEELPELLARAFVDAYPELEFSYMADELIEESIREEDGYLSFALSYGCVHIYADKNWLAMSDSGQHITLSYADYPELVYEYYQTSPEKWIIKLEYGVNYIAEGGAMLSMDWTEMTDMEIRWTAVVNGRGINEVFYGYEPECYLSGINGKSYLYVKVPAGDVSMYSYIYEVTPWGLVKKDEIGAALDQETNLNPDRLRLYTNNIVYAGYMMLLPSGWYSLDGEGIPMLTEGYGLSSMTMTLLQTIEAMEVDREDPLGLVERSTLWEGTQMTPFRTDGYSYIDFLTGNGRAFRLEIDGFHDEMQFIGFGTSEDLFSY